MTILDAPTGPGGWYVRNSEHEKWRLLEITEDHWRKGIGTRAYNQYYGPLLPPDIVTPDVPAKLVPYQMPGETLRQALLRQPVELDDVAHRALRQAAQDVIDAAPTLPAPDVQAQSRMFPLQASREVEPHPLSIPWSVAEKAYSAYAAKYGRGQTLERLAERGGFSGGEMDMLYPGWRAECDDVQAQDIDHVALPDCRCNDCWQAQIDAAVAREREAQSRDATRGRFVVENAAWHRDEGRTFLVVEVAVGADLSCVALREDALDAAIRARAKVG